MQPDGMQQDKKSDFIVIADLHLQHNSEATIRLANQFFATKAHTTRHLYIAGDLVEYWIGDDAHTGELTDTFSLLRTLRDTNTDVTVMHGNRDFLLGDDFAARIRGTLERRDCITLHSDSRQFLLLHGDTLCTDDRDYQAVRVQLRDPKWQIQFLDQPIEARRAFAQSARERSKEDSLQKSAQIMDVNEQAVLDLMSETGITQIIHGHTHRPACHTVALPDSLSQRHGNTGNRWVVGDWHPDHAQYVEASGGQAELKTWRAV